VRVDVVEPGLEQLCHRDASSVAGRRVLEFGDHLGQSGLRLLFGALELRAT
jgi:hypothetical protein